MNYTYDAASRPATAADSANGITYASGQSSPPTGCSSTGVCYTPQGAEYSSAIGVTSGFAGVNFSETYNSRLQPLEIKASSAAGNAIDITYSFLDPVTSKNAGHVYGITNNLNSSRTQSFTYDQVNRIVTAGTAATSGTYCWGYQYIYDGAWGNLTSQAGWSPNYNGCSEATMGSVSADGNNHISAFSYDFRGNTTSDGSITYTYDAESQIKTAAGVSYSYDGSGRRVSKSNGKLYWYGSGGEILAETDASGNTLNEYIFFGGKRIAILPSGGSAQYYIEDLLGSSRAMTQNNGTPCYDADFDPYGGEHAYVNSCAQNYKFEGKERDTETGNDDFGARYYTSRFGRWLSSDWSSVPVPVPYANLTNPQTLNLYSMVADDPESFADLDGHINPENITSCGIAAEFSCAGAPDDTAPHNVLWNDKNGNAVSLNQAPAQNQNANAPATTSLPSVLHRTYKWYQFATKWWDRWTEANKLIDEKKTDAAIFKMVSDVTFDPIGHLNSQVLGQYAEIYRLEEVNLVLDAFRSGEKIAGGLDAVGPLGVYGETLDAQFNSAGRIRDANNKAIDKLLGEAAAALTPH